MKKPEKKYVCYLCPDKPSFNTLKHFKHHTKKVHKGKIGVVFR